MKRALVIIISIAVLVGGGFAIWQIQDQSARAAKLEAEILKGLTAEELSAVLKSEALAGRQVIEDMKNNAGKRKLFLKGLKEYLGLAAQARREGFAENENFKINFEYKKRILVADLYKFTISQGKDKLYVVPQKEIDAVWAEPKNGKAFDRDMQALREIRIEDSRLRGKDEPIPELQGESLKKARGKWARTKILSKMAKKDTEFMNQPALSLRYKILEAGILSNDYLRANWAEKIKPTDAEIADYLKEHPEFDVKKKLEKAELVLAKVKAGENFEKLAKEYSEDRASNHRGGFYRDVGPDGYLERG